MLPRVSGGGRHASSQACTPRSSTPATRSSRRPARDPVGGRRGLSGAAGGRRRLRAARVWRQPGRPRAQRGRRPLDRWRDCPTASGVIWATVARSTPAIRAAREPHVRVRPYLSPIAEAYAAADLALDPGWRDDDGGALRVGHSHGARAAADCGGGPSDRQRTSARRRWGGDDATASVPHGGAARGRHRTAAAGAGATGGPRGERTRTGQAASGGGYCSTDT